MSVLLRALSRVSRHVIPTCKATGRSHYQLSLWLEIGNCSTNNQQVTAAIGYSFTSFVSDLSACQTLVRPHPRRSVWPVNKTSSWSLSREPIQDMFIKEAAAIISKYKLLTQAHLYQATLGKIP
jgi:hypothetical protein